ncbi:UNVERIFIED_CONTAM: hypothetical protein GTU68_046450 [Idotea baltica]|nr:hypothetical protein [Idotea baltica]
MGLTFLTNLLENELQHQTGRGRALSTSLQILTALRYLASGSFQQVIGDTVNISQATSSRCVNRFIEAMLVHLPEFITKPTNDELRTINQGFYNMAHFPSVIGCIDCTHIRILTPSENPLDYVNRKGYHSINVQAICDHKGKIRNLVARWPGSSHDSWILRQSAIWNHHELHPNAGYILGDGAYPCRPWLLTPYANPNHPNRVRFNESHTRTRVLIENTFGRLKRRFGILHSEVRMKPEKVCKVIAVCAILHNIAIDRRYPDNFDDDINIDDNVPIEMMNNPNNGNAFRDVVANAHFI